MILAIGGMVAAAAKELEDDVVFRITEGEDAFFIRKEHSIVIIPKLTHDRSPHSATFEHEQFWVDRDTNQVEGRFTYATPEGRELETRYGRN